MNKKRVQLIFCVVCIPLIIIGCNNKRDIIVNEKENINGYKEIHGLDYKITNSDIGPKNIQTKVSSISTETPTEVTIESTDFELETSTVSNMDEKAWLMNMLNDPSSCVLPYWWGVNPGTVSWNEAMRIIDFNKVDFFQDNDQEGGLYHIGFIKLPDQISNNFIFLEDNKIVNEISISTQDYENTKIFREIWTNYYPNIILEKYGLPDNVFLYVFDYDGLETKFTPYTLWLLYEKYDFFIRYEGFVENTYTIFHICPNSDGNQIYSIEIRIFSEDKPINIEKGISGQIDGDENIKNQLKKYQIWILKNSIKH